MELIVADLYEVYRLAALALKTGVAVAKSKSWDKLLLTINDPWGRPYKAVLGKLRPWAPPITEKLDPELLGRVTSTLDGEGGRGSDRAPGPTHEWLDEFRVTERELSLAVRDQRARGKKAPGPDGVPGRILVEALQVLVPEYRSVLNAMRRGG